MKIISLKKRKDFLDIAANGQKSVAKGLIIQVKESTDINNDVIKVGYTATKKLGNAVTRNRIKRKLRAVASHIMPKFASNSYEYVIIGRKAALDRNFEDLVKDLKFTLHSTKTHK